VGCGESQPTEPPTVAPEILIHEAARDGNIEAVKQHLAAGTDVDAKDMNGETSLTWAAYSGHKEIAELLIAEGADVNAKSNRGDTPLDFAIGVTNKVANLLRKHGGKHSIFGATSQGNIEAVKERLAAGANVNAKDGVGRTPLDRAVESNQPEIADLLRKHGGKTSEELKAEGK